MDRSVAALAEPVPARAEQGRQGDDPGAKALHVEAFLEVLGVDFLGDGEDFPAELLRVAGFAVELDCDELLDPCLQHLGDGASPRAYQAELMQELRIEAADDLVEHAALMGGQSRGEATIVAHEGRILGIDASVGEELARRGGKALGDRAGVVALAALLGALAPEIMGKSLLRS